MGRSEGDDPRVVLKHRRSRGRRGRCRRDARQVNTEAILALIGDLYAQIVALQAEVARLTPKE